MMKLFLAIFDQCIDDLICMERMSTASSARSSWLSFAALCGWDIPLKKSPEHSQLFRALGVFINLSPLPWAPAEVCACQKRIEAVCETITSIVQCKHLSSSLAASIAGKLLFSASAFVGRFGRAMLRAFSRRAQEVGRFNLNPQILATCDWWLRGLRLAPPRPSKHKPCNAGASE